MVVTLQSRTAVPFRGETTYNLIGLRPKRDCSLPQEGYKPIGTSKYKYTYFVYSDQNKNILLCYIQHSVSARPAVAQGGSCCAHAARVVPCRYRVRCKLGHQSLLIHLRKYPAVVAGAVCFRHFSSAFDVPRGAADAELLLTVIVLFTIKNLAHPQVDSMPDRPCQLLGAVHFHSESFPSFKLFFNGFPYLHCMCTYCC